MLKKATVLAILFASPAVAQEARKLAAGASMTVELTENLSTGYSWRIDQAASTGLDLVAITDRGHAQVHNIPGAPGTHSWRIEALKPGKAVVRFVYQRPWEPEPIETHRIRIIISR